MSSPAAAAAALPAQKKEDKVRPASAIDGEEESPPKKARSSDSTPKERLDAFLATYPKDKQFVMVIKTRSALDEIDAYSFSLPVLEKQFKTTLEKLRKLDDEKLYRLFFKRDDEFNYDEDALDAYTACMKEASREGYFGYSIDNDAGDILVETFAIQDYSE